MMTIANDNEELINDFYKKLAYYDESFIAKCEKSGMTQQETCSALLSDVFRNHIINSIVDLNRLSIQRIIK